MSNLYILKYNNYYNRIVKKENSLSDYLEFLHYDLLNANFNVKDGINTNHVFGSSINSYDGQGDYLVVTSNSDVIESRWFIVEAMRQLTGQWVLTLRRDLMVDYYNQIIEADTYIEKAILNDDDTLIFNSEALNVNQIKTSQEQLKDATNCAWLVGYLAPNIDEPLEITASNKIDYDFTVDGIENWEYYNQSNLGTNSGIITNINSKVLYMNVKEFEGNYYDRYSFSIQNPNYPILQERAGSFDKVSEFYYARNTDKVKIKNTAYNNILTNIEAISDIIVSHFGNKIQIDNSIVNLNGSVIKDTENDIYYTLTVTPNGTVSLSEQITTTSADDIALINKVLGSPSSSLGPIYYIDNTMYRGTGVTTFNYPGFDIAVSGQRYKIELKEKTTLTSKVTITNDAMIPEDAPYRMFCMPYQPEGFGFNFRIGNFLYSMKPETSMSIMTTLITKYSGNFIYDAQILPYCPVKEFFDPTEQFDLENVQSSTGNSLEGIKYIVVKDPTNTKIQGFIAFASKVSFTTQINKKNPIENIKISNECDKYRLCSPNFNGAFDFNLAKNKGLDGFTVSCTYKPYQPYIKISPIFSGLYGQNFKDPRGLICGGDFGLSLLNDKWAEYEINNKNYLNSFNRQIENMEIKNNISRIQDIVGAGAGALGGAAAGAAAGSMVAPGIGTALGAIAGGVVSAAGGAADIFINEKLRAETLDYTKDQFNYSLQNIQALPYTLSRVSSLTVDNTIYPIIEYYTCSEREKEAFANKIAYNSMTVMVIGKIKYYINNEWRYKNIKSKGYIKGKIINITNINEDYHIASAIAEEINKGGFFKWE